MQLANQLELCLHKLTQIVASAACRVGSQEFHSWIASLPLVSLLFIVIPTPFLNFFLWTSKDSNILGKEKSPKEVSFIPYPLFITS